MGQYSISTLVKLPFDRALRETQRALAEEEFVIITEIDLQGELAKKLGQQIRPYTILGVWVPSWEYEALSREPDIGTAHAQPRVPVGQWGWQLHFGHRGPQTPLQHGGEPAPGGSRARGQRPAAGSSGFRCKFTGMMGAPKPPENRVAGEN